MSLYEKVEQIASRMKRNSRLKILVKAEGKTFNVIIFKENESFYYTAK